MMRAIKHLGWLLGAVSAAAAAAQTGLPGGAINRNLGEMDYGVCRGTDPACFHDWPRAPATKYRILVFTRTGASRHANLGKVLPGGLNPALGEDNVVQRAMLRIAAENGWDIDYTEDVAQMTSLTGYNAVIFLSTSRDILDDAAKTALRQYMRAGGGFVAVHNAFGTLYNWPYYEGLLGGANFYDHAPARDGDVVIVDGKDTSTRGLPSRFRFHDEWYNLVPFPTRVRFLATVDERSLPIPAVADTPAAVVATMGAPGARLPAEIVRPRYPSVVGRHPGHGTFHPLAWCQYYDGGKVWATTLGHDAKAFEKNGQPGAAEFQAMLIGGIKSVMGQAPFCR
ncbi:ThuA domain-containing protein [Sphingomonas sp. BIUV-7]|uniref:ThuA domain-containing protein n=1 Tax=Sphingomonas natans TaxID=3063330 RepID=A0ABT8YDT6_9SPHN|nr:ThuA domain-containing protein [Sphingomonas sp. BIUV-7]MDO6415814.1 ThuA domain-containing protein [Sphingomonas sp. BIUV-7]